MLSVFNWCINNLSVIILDEIPKRYLKCFIFYGLYFSGCIVLLKILRNCILTDKSLINNDIKPQNYFLITLKVYLNCRILTFNNNYKKSFVQDILKIAAITSSKTVEDNLLMFEQNQLLNR